jgi:hypothetical protein
MICLARTCSCRQQELQTFDVLTIKHGFESMRAGGRCAMAKQQLRTGQIAMFGRMMERFGIARIRSRLEQAQG